MINREPLLIALHHTSSDELAYELLAIFLQIMHNKLTHAHI